MAVRVRCDKDVQGFVLLGEKIAKITDTFSDLSDGDLSDFGHQWGARKNKGVGGIIVTRDIGDHFWQRCIKIPITILSCVRANVGFGTVGRAQPRGVTHRPDGIVFERFFKWDLGCEFKRGEGDIFCQRPKNLKHHMRRCVIRDKSIGC